MINQQTFKSTNPKIYLIGTPIGNLTDFSPRAVEVLKSVKVIFCEDTRTSQVLFEKYEIQKRLVSLHKFNESERFEMVEQLIQQGSSCALVSDAGVPLISDPGAKIVVFCRQQFGQIVDITAINAGPAYLHALIMSGFVAGPNCFVGFLKNRQSTARRQELLTLLNQFHQHSTIIFYESVHRVQETMEILASILPSTQQIALARELTKINEQFLIGSLAEINDYLKSPQFVVKGEFVIIIEQNQQLVVPSQWTEAEICQKVDQYLKQGLKLKQAAQMVSYETHQKVKEIYQLYLKMKKNSNL